MVTAVETLENSALKTSPGFSTGPAAAALDYWRHVFELNNQYERGEIKVSVPEALRDLGRLWEEVVEQCFPLSHAQFSRASAGLFSALPVSFNPRNSIGPYLASDDLDANGNPYMFLDLGSQIASQPFGFNFIPTVEAMMLNPEHSVNRPAHCEYQTALSLAVKEELSKCAPNGTPRFFIVNTGAEAVENALKACLLNRVKTSGVEQGAFVMSFHAAFHGRSMGALAVTWSPKARLGFPTFDWPSAPFPYEEVNNEGATQTRELRCLKKVGLTIVSGGQATKSIDETLVEAHLKAIEQAYLSGFSDVQTLITQQRILASEEQKAQAIKAAAVLIEPIQGEGGIRTATPRFMQMLRVLTAIYDVPLIFDEIQTGLGATGKMWAHEHFNLPLPPDAVLSAKKLQNGVVFLNERLATFFQEERKFNTTWEGCAAGMLRFMSFIKQIDLNQVQDVGEKARQGLQKIADQNPDLLSDIRGKGVMLGFTVKRTDYRDELRECAFRRGLITLPAGNNTLRFYPSYNMRPKALDEALAILEAAVKDVRIDRQRNTIRGDLDMTTGTYYVPLEVISAKSIDAEGFARVKNTIEDLERSSYAAEGRGLLILPIKALHRTVKHSKSLGIIISESISDKPIGYALGAPLESFDDEGAKDDPNFGGRNTFYVQAIAIAPHVQNKAEVTEKLLTLIQEEARKAKFKNISSLVEVDVAQHFPPWAQALKDAKIIKNYLGSGVEIAYLSAPIS